MKVHDDVQDTLLGGEYYAIADMIQCICLGKATIAVYTILYHMWLFIFLLLADKNINRKSNLYYSVWNGARYHITTP